MHALFGAYLSELHHLYLLLIICCRHPDQRLLSNLLFWQEVIDYGIAEDRAADRMLRMGQAWSIFSRFIIDDGVWDIGKLIHWF